MSIIINKIRQNSPRLAAGNGEYPFPAPVGLGQLDGKCKTFSVYEDTLQLAAGGDFISIEKVTIL